MMKKLKKVPYMQKLLLLLADVVFANLSIALNLFITRGGSFAKIPMSAAFFLPISIIVFPIIAYLNGSHRVIWQHAGVRDIVKLTLASFASFTFCVLSVTVIGKGYVFYAIEWISAMMLTAIMSVTFRMFLRHIAIRTEKSEKKEATKGSGGVADFGNTMIIGGGSASEILLREIFTSATFSGCKPVVIVDDNESIHGLSVRGAPILGDRNDIEKLAKAYKIKTIFFAIPSCSAENKREVLRICSKTGCDTRVMPGINEMINNENPGLKLRKVEIAEIDEAFEIWIVEQKPNGELDYSAAMELNKFQRHCASIT